ncbi:hypothetical protein HY949_02640 [Candidatus Gottesmanbacteria bacterium]|nr:hypothetical protein [Candidatus Gottesmanbacteria bacterium]
MAEEILSTDQVLLRDVDPWTRPIAGLRLIAHEGESAYAFTPREILSDQVRPIIIFDLDDTVWEHVRHVVTAVSEATGIHVSWEEFLHYGHTRKIPAWKDSPNAMEKHDQIQQGEHMDYFPFVNRAWPQAHDTIEAVYFMGHDFSFLTARSPKLFRATLRVLEWNDIPHDHQHALIDAKFHDYPQSGVLYCAHSALADVNQYKYEVVKQWLGNLWNNGRKGSVVVIDDLLKSYQPLVESGDVVGISLAGPLNQNMPPYTRELRVSSWEEIGDLLMEIHRQAVAKDPSLFRLFDCRPMMEDTLLVASKNETSNGEFALEDICHWAFVSVKRWQENQSEVLKEIGIT